MRCRENLGDERDKPWYFTNERSVVTNLGCEAEEETSYSGAVFVQVDLDWVIGRGSTLKRERSLGRVLCP